VLLASKDMWVEELPEGSSCGVKEEIPVCRWSVDEKLVSGYIYNCSPYSALSDFTGAHHPFMEG